MKTLKKHKLKKSKIDPDILSMYERILFQKGIHCEQTRESFDKCYARYKELGGGVRFRWDE